MNLLANPVLLRMIMLLLFAASAFVMGVWFIRRMRREMMADLSTPAPRVEREPAFVVATFNGVIQQLKESEQELHRLRQVAQGRASASENIAAAVLTNLETGVVVFSPAGLAQQANPAAREILGYATISGMHARHLFRGISSLRSSNGQAAPADVSEALERALHNASVFRGLVAEYATPSGVLRKLRMTIVPALGPAGECLGAVCLVTDCTCSNG